MNLIKITKFKNTEGEPSPIYFSSISWDLSEMPFVTQQLPVEGTFLLGHCGIIKQSVCLAKSILNFHHQVKKVSLSESLGDAESYMAMIFRYFFDFTVLYSLELLLYFFTCF